MTTTTLVIATTVKAAVAIGRQLAGATRAIPASPHTIRDYGAARGLVVDAILIDQAIWPLADDVTHHLDVLRMMGAPMLLWPTGDPAPERAAAAALTA